MSIREPELPIDEPLNDRERAERARFERFDEACYKADIMLGGIPPEISEQGLLFGRYGGVEFIDATVDLRFYASDDPKEIIRSYVAALRSAADAAERRL